MQFNLWELLIQPSFRWVLLSHFDWSLLLNGFNFISTVVSELGTGHLLLFVGNCCALFHFKTIRIISFLIVYLLFSKLSFIYLFILWLISLLLCWSLSGIQDLLRRHRKRYRLWNGFALRIALYWWRMGVTFFWFVFSYWPNKAMICSGMVESIVFFGLQSGE